jgi:hypothetical protein
MVCVKIFDARGRLIFEQSGIKAITKTLNDWRAAQRVMLVQITSEENKGLPKK